MKEERALRGATKTGGEFCGYWAFEKLKTNSSTELHLLVTTSCLAGTVFLVAELEKGLPRGQLRPQHVGEAHLLHVSSHFDSELNSLLR